LIVVGLVLGALDGMPTGGMIGLLVGIALIVIGSLLKEDHAVLESASMAAKPAA
jgi:membrane-bound ClpP family serine protease